MSPLEEGMHLFSLFRQGSDAERKSLITDIRDRMIDRLSEVVSKVPRPESASILAEHRRLGFDLRWVLTDSDEAAAFVVMAKRTSGISADELAAVDCLDACSYALGADDFRQELRERIVLSYMMLSLPDVKRAVIQAKGSVTGRPRRSAQAKDAVMQKYGNVAVEVAKECVAERQSTGERPPSLAEIARQVRTRWSLKTSKDSSRYLPQDDKAILTFLRKHKESWDVSGGGV